MKNTTLGVFEYSHQQYLKDELIKIDDVILASFKIEPKKWNEVFDRYNLSTNNAYFQSGALFPKAYYLGEYSATEIALDLKLLESEFFGLKKIEDRENYFKQMFLAEQYELCFHPEFNPLALFYFLKHFKNINNSKVYEAFLGLYENINFGFGKIPPSIYDEIFKFAPTTDAIIKKLQDDGVEITSPDAILTIYRGQGEKSTSIDKTFSWTLSKTTAKRFADFCKGSLYQAKVKVDDIIDYLQGGEKEVLVDYKNLTGVTLL